SARARVERIVDFLVRDDIDVLAMQEIKCRDDQFPHERFTAAGYEVVTHGLNQWNGVAIASRLPIDETAIGFPGMPGFGEPGAKAPAGADPEGRPLEARAMRATVDGIEIWSLYVPNGRSLDHDHYRYKLAWLDALRAHTEQRLADAPEVPLALTGDWNVAPTDADMGDPSFGPGSTHVSAPEREAFAAFTRAGLSDVVRPLVPEGYTFWDYTQLRFPRDEGMRIDFILGSDAFARLVEGAQIARDERKGDGPSDHVPVVVDIAGDEDEDDRPMIFG
ncbi:exodeoxyribonuclease III, partial [Mycetocola reblochoni]